MKRLLPLLMLFCALLAICPARAEEPDRRVLVMLHLPAPHFRADANYGGRYGDDAGHAARRRIAEELAKTHRLKLDGDWPMPVLGVDCYVMEVPSDQSPLQAAEALSHDRRVEWAQPLTSYRGLGDGNDPLYKTQPSAGLWHLDEIHRRADGRGVRVAVIDSGIDDRHADLSGQVVAKENFVDGNPYVPERHGTGVAGIIVARAGNGAGIEGIAPGARLMALRACWESGGAPARCDSFTLGKALQYAILNDARIINLSLTGPSDRLLQRLLDEALRRGIGVIGAVDPQDPSGGFPASHPGVVAVAEQGQPNGKIRFLRAPGIDIPTAEAGGGWHFVSGSSYAAAHVSGLAALLNEIKPGLKISAFLAKMPDSSGATQASAASGDMIDACRVLASASGDCVCGCRPLQSARTGH